MISNGSQAHLEDKDQQSTIRKEKETFNKYSIQITYSPITTKLKYVHLNIYFMTT